MNFISISHVALVIWQRQQHNYAQCFHKINWLQWTTIFFPLLYMSPGLVWFGVRLWADLRKLHSIEIYCSLNGNVNMLWLLDFNSKSIIINVMHVTCVTYIDNMNWIRKLFHRLWWNFFECSRWNEKYENRILTQSHSISLFGTILKSLWIPKCFHFVEILCHFQLCSVKEPLFKS